MNVYDFDNTIYDGESMVDFFLMCVKKHPRLIRLMPEIFIKLLKYKRCRMTREELFDFAECNARYLIDILGDISAEVREFWDKNIEKIRSYYILNKKPDDVIISASAGFLLKEACERLGIKYLICSDVDVKTGKINQLCFRSEKPELFRKYFPDSAVDCFYTDSMNDKPMIGIADKAYLVKGDKMKKIK